MVAAESPTPWWCSRCHAMVYGPASRPARPEARRREEPARAEESQTPRSRMAVEPASPCRTSYTPSPSMLADLSARPRLGETSEVASRLEHVVWIGGGSGAGESTVALRLANEYGLRVYATDAAMS